MNKKPMVMAITILAIVSMAFPLASSGFTNYIFQEDFNGTTLDNSTWVNQSTPFPYEMKDGQLIIKTYQEPENKYARTKTYDITGIDSIHIETKITFDMDRVQNNFMDSAFRISYFLGKNDGTFSNQYNSTDVQFRMFFGTQLEIESIIGKSTVSKNYGEPYTEKFYGNETVFYIVGDYNRHLNKTNETDYWTAQITIENETHIPIIANLDRLTDVEDIFSVQLRDSHRSTQPPADGEIRIDYIYAGEYEIKEEAPKQNMFPLLLTFSMVFMSIGAIGTLADTFGKYEDLWFYMMLLGIGLLGVAFIFLPEMILGIPAYLYSIPPFLLVIEELYSVRQHGLF